MTHLIKMLLSFVLLCLIFSIQAQNIHDLNHSKQFADFLYKTEQFQLAAEELERIVFLDPTNRNLKLKLIKSYRKANSYQQALNKFDILFKENLIELPPDFAEEYVKLLIFTKQDSTAYNYLSLNKTLNPTTRQNYQLATLLLQKKWDDSFQYAMKYPVKDNTKNTNLHLLAFEAKQLKYKKPVVAGLMSAIIPGSGKAYTKNWKDAAISFIFVGVNAWQAYRGFDKYGSKSAYGWVFAGLSAGFYFGNIYGSVKSVKKYNKKLDDALYHKAEHTIFNNM
jgi:tetratricopeptide (TPR) repeat protein